MNVLVKILAPWYNIKEARKREEKTEAIHQEGLLAVSRTDHLIQSYQRASQALHER